MLKIKLTKRQYELLWMDCYCEYVEGDSNPAPELRPLRDELRAGRVVTISPMLTEQLIEFADRDQETIEQQVYRRLLRKVKQSA